MLFSQETANCKLCGSHNIWHYYKSDASAITSDSKIVERPIDIRYCRECSNLFKNRDTCDINIINKINESMVLYGCNGISEHRVAFDKYPGGIERSSHQLNYISKNIELDNTKYILDYGCHYGAFLSKFNVNYPNRFLYGYDISNKYKNHIHSITERSFFTTDVQDLMNVQFDLILVSHVLEHVEDPLSTLQFLKERLKSTGFLFLQLVNTEENPFASLIFEQYYHFSCYGIKRLIEICEFEIINFNTSWIAKEISLLIRNKKQKGSIPGQDQDKSISKERTDSIMNENCELLKQMEKNLYHTKNMGRSVGVFGTSIAGTWAGSILDTSLKYYVDEDTTKQGKKHLGIDVIPPEKVGNNDIVYVLLPKKVAVKVAERLSSKSRAAYIIPPFNITT